LGSLQKKLETNNELKAILPDCTAQGLQNAAVAAGTWIYDTAVGDEHRLTKEYIESLRSADAFFEKLTSILGIFPPTCVHGDFWFGNWAVSEGVIRIFDWGDALWGVGGLSIASLLAQHGELSSSKEVMWQVYGDTIERDITADYKQMCEIALDITK
jgi:fructosamine-3-kinase